ncbi:glutathione S-transferase family protein [Aureimonas glaciei]|uniref:Glutathione S-transferase n=1 Tax=Aureimonas glaciei TaxID=1776957 RepID=A0A917D7W2_9HYPH|nr:glutathione S-transferase [Aureimonas glaciei]GGD13168.1 glutathione S-transferase [Aureimonas glaciei]
MRLFSSPASPFVAKVRMAAQHVGIPLETVATDAGAEPAELLAANPLGKIPALILDDGAVVFDSKVICDLLDRRSGHKLVPQDEAGWLRTKRMEVTADGVGDAMILTLYEGRYRPEEKRHQPWVDKQMRKAFRGLDVLEAEIDTLGPDLTTAHFAVAGVLGWLDLRFKGQWETGRPRLVAWVERFADAFPAYRELKPRA